MLLAVFFAAVNLTIHAGQCLGDGQVDAALRAADHFFRRAARGFGRTGDIRLILGEGVRLGFFRGRNPAPCHINHHRPEQIFHVSPRCKTTSITNRLPT